METNKSIEEQIIVAQEEILKSSGLWATPQLMEKYSYRLSPDALKISEKERQDLEKISKLLYEEGGFFDGALKLYEKSLDPRFASRPAGNIVRRALTNGIVKKELPMQGIIKNLPIISRADLIKVDNPEDGEQRFQIAEVEGDKTHGFGYLTLIDFFKKEFLGRQDTKGIINTLKESLEQKNIDPGTPIVALVGDSERFYLGELVLFSEACRNNGINLFAIPEVDIRVTENGISSDYAPEANILLNLPTLTPRGYMSTDIDQERIFSMIADGKIDCLIPPNRFMGSKGLLAVVSNGDNNVELEEALNEVFSPHVLTELRTFIPPTILLTKKNRNFVAGILSSQPDDWVIKKTVSSGMKGVALPNDKEKMLSFAQAALDAPFNYVIQKKVNQARETFRYTDPGSTLIKNASMYMRIELFSSSNGISTVAVTARETPSVHGAHDAIQIPAIFT